MMHIVLNIFLILVHVFLIDARPGPVKIPEFADHADIPHLDHIPVKKMSEDAVDAIKKACVKNPRACKEQSESAKKTKELVTSVLLARGKNRDEIKHHFDLVNSAKLAILDQFGLKNLVIPSDTGVWAGDQLLTIDQLHRIIDQSNISAQARRKRANSISLDYYTGNKWPSTTVNYYLDPNLFSSQESNLIRAAVKSIQDQTCLTFSESQQIPYIKFSKTPYGTSSGTCGMADLGYSGSINEAYLNFDSTDCRPTLQGVVVHEILHILGISHEHNRYDRDNYVRMNWDNIDPQLYDMYNHDDSYDYNPYCIPYDYLSVMHYSPQVGVKDQYKPAFTPLTNPEYYSPKIGTGNSPSTSDAALVNRLYCAPASCKDEVPYCGWTACNDCTTYGSKCQKSCGKCPYSRNG